MKSAATIAGALLVAALVYCVYPSEPEAPVKLLANPHASDRGPSFALPTAAQYDASSRFQNPVFNVSEQGEFSIDHDTAGRLDILISGLPKYPSAQELQRVEEIALAGLSDQARMKAQRLLRDFIAYRGEEAELLSQARGTDKTALEELDGRLHALRRQRFELAVADILFNRQDAQTRYAREMDRIQSDLSLKEESRAQLLADLQQAFPDGRIGSDGAGMQLALSERAARLRENAEQGSVPQTPQQFPGMGN